MPFPSLTAYNIKLPLAYCSILGTCGLGIFAGAISLLTKIILGLEMTLELPFISTTRLLLRLATPKDVPEIIRYFRINRAYLAPWVPLWPLNYLTQSFWEEQVEKNFKEFHCDQSLRLFIFKNTNISQVIGQVNFNGFVRGAGQFCYLGYSLSEIEQGKGYMLEALRAAINYIFEKLNMHRVIANYIPQNHRSGNLLKKLGFFVEGYAKDYLLINGKWQDHILTSLTNKNWQAEG